jgi:hypothetical protein
LPHLFGRPGEERQTNKKAEDVYSMPGSSIDRQTLQSLCERSDLGEQSFCSVSELWRTRQEERGYRGAVLSVWRSRIAGTYSGTSPLLARRGGSGIKKNDAPATLTAGDGVVAQDRKERIEPPPRPLLPGEATRYFLDVASTPPGQEGRWIHLDLRMKLYFKRMAGRKAHRLPYR